MSKEQHIVLATSYFGPVQYFTKFLLPGKIVLEKHENYIKQSFRNRTVILGANGPLTLTVPVIRGSFHKVPIGKLEIDYKKNWQDTHWRSIESAYRSAPYFEFYVDEIVSVFQMKTGILLDLNESILKKMLNLLHLKEDFANTQSYSETVYSLDYRETVHPKKKMPDPLFYPAEYPQVFQSKFGFTANLSILDLLFNTGPDAKIILQKSIVVPVQPENDPA